MLEKSEEFTLIDPDDEEYKEILKNARRKLETYGTSCAV